jgi:hypothetical protein
MTFLPCKLGSHTWEGCKCKFCDKTRDQEHDWSKDCGICYKCGKTRIVEHFWNGCFCKICGKTRDEEHDWSKDCEKCSKCGSTREMHHAWNGCLCTACLKSRDEDHIWDGCKCSKCGVFRDEQHSWDKCICSKCGKTKFEKYSWADLKCNSYGRVTEQPSDKYGCSTCKITKEEVLKGFIGKNVIISFIDWQKSGAKKDTDLLCYFSSNPQKGTHINFCFMKDGPALVRIDYIENIHNNNYLVFFDFRHQLFYTRCATDVREISIFDGSSDDILNYISNNSDQLENIPAKIEYGISQYSNLVLSSSNEKDRSSALGLLMTSLSGLNLLTKGTKMFDQSFFKVFINNPDLSPLNIIEYKAKIPIDLFFTGEQYISCIYRPLMKRGILGGDIRYFKTFWQLYNQIYNPPKC